MDPLSGLVAQRLLNATSGSLLQTFANPTPVFDDRFGGSVAISGNNVLIGARFDDTTGSDSGSAYLFDATTGSLLQTFANPTPGGFDQFGESVAISGNNVLIGAYRDDTTGDNSGSAYLFDATSGSLLQTFANPTPGSGDWFGTSVAISGNNVLIGTERDDTTGSDSGSAFLFSSAEAVPVPAPLPVLGVGVAFAWTRKLRHSSRRLRQARVASFR